MPDGPVTGDAFGALLSCQLDTGQAMEIVERDDGFIAAAAAARYLDPPEDWPPLDVAAVGRCTGRVLDIGAGAGRASLALQDRGHDVLALDTSPEAIRVCRRRGVRATFTGTAAKLARDQPEPFDTFLLLGNNLGLLEAPQIAPGFLATLAAMSGRHATVVGTGMDPYLTREPLHLRYHERNRAAGRAGGQLRIRVRHRDIATPWFGYWLAAPGELEQLVAGTGWRLTDVQAGDGPYLAVLAKR